MSSAPWRTQLIVPPVEHYSQLRGLIVMARNPAQWWSADIYDQGVRSVRLFDRTRVHVARPELARIVLLDDNDAFGRSFVTQRILVPAMGGGLLTSGGGQRRHQRRLTAPVFHAKALKSFVPAMDRHALVVRPPSNYGFRVAQPLSCKAALCRPMVYKQGGHTSNKANAVRTTAVPLPAGVSVCARTCVTLARRMPPLVYNYGPSQECLVANADRHAEPAIRRWTDH